MPKSRLTVAAICFLSCPVALSQVAINPWWPHSNPTVLTGSAYGLLDVYHGGDPNVNGGSVTIERFESTNDVGALWGHLSTIGSPPIALATDSATYQPYYGCEAPTYTDSCPSGWYPTSQFHYSVDIAAQSRAAGLEVVTGGSSRLRYDVGGDLTQPWLRTFAPQINQETQSGFTFHFDPAIDPTFASARVFWSGSLGSQWTKDRDGGSLSLTSTVGMLAQDENGVSSDGSILQNLNVQENGVLWLSFSLSQFINGKGSISLTLNSRATLDSFASEVGDVGYDDAEWKTWIDFGYLHVQYNYTDGRSIEASYSFDAAGTPIAIFNELPVAIPVVEPPVATLFLLGFSLLATIARRQRSQHSNSIAIPIVSAA